MGVSRVYTDCCLHEPRLTADFPINMAVSEAVLRANSHALPQMRFLLNDEQVLGLTAQILFSKARLGTSSTSDGSKIVQIKKFVSCLFQDFFTVDMAQGDDKRLANLSEDDVDLIGNDGHSYYTAKFAKGFEFANEANSSTPFDASKTDPESSPQR